MLIDKTVVVISGGLDSTTLLYDLMDKQHEVKAVSINYQQKHAKELRFAESICNNLGIEHRLIELPGLTQVLGNNALTNSDVEVPSGQYENGTIQITTVPNRNMIFLSVAIGWAATLKFNGVAFGAHAGVHTNYPDCKPVFADAMNAAAMVCDWDPICVYSPFIEFTKADIVRRGIELSVPFEKTWSCYRGGEFHCGSCSTCQDRIAAFEQCGARDPVKYLQCCKVDS